MLDITELIDITELKQRLEAIASFEDAKFCLDPRIPLEIREYWTRDAKRRKFYESHPLWERYREIDYIPSITLQENYHLLDMAEVNKQLIPRGYLYYCSSGLGGKLKLLLGEIKEHRRVQEVNVFLINRELVCNCELNSPSLYNHEEKIIVGRERSAEFSVWRRIEELRSASGVRKQLLEIELYNLTELKDFNANPVEIQDAVRKAAEWKLKAWIAHELGHYAAKKYLPHSIYNSCKKFCLSRGDLALDAFITAVNDVLADTICESEIKGSIAYILQLPEKQKLGLLSSHILDIFNPPAEFKVLNEKSKLEAELISTFLKNLNLVSNEELNRAREAVFERAKQFALAINQSFSD
ncbi:MAG: hypothetical protein QXJ68_04490 [Methanocellales archaeon]